MPRKPSVRYWESRNGFYCTIKGEQVRLGDGPDDSAKDGPKYRAACKRFGELTCDDGASLAKDANTLETVCRLYLERISTRRKPRTVELRRRYLLAFVGEFGTVRVRDLTVHQVERFCDRMRQPRTHKQTGHETCWSDGSVRNAIDSLNAALNWAIEAGVTATNPIRKAEKPSAQSRGEEAVISQELHGKILAASNAWLRPIVVCLEATGCRPGELVDATAAHFDPARNALVYKAKKKEHKTSRTGKDRVILLTGEALKIVRELVGKYPTGPLFRTRCPKQVGEHAGQCWGWDVDELSATFRGLRRRVGCPKLTAMSYRHTFATNWLLSGKSVDILAQLMGNSPMVIRQHYAHLLNQSDELRRQLEEFRSGK